MACVVNRIRLNYMHSKLKKQSYENLKSVLHTTFVKHFFLEFI
jgi:hypothetical protein